MIPILRGNSPIGRCVCDALFVGHFLPMDSFAISICKREIFDKKLPAIWTVFELRLRVPSSLVSGIGEPCSTSGGDNDVDVDVVSRSGSCAAGDGVREKKPGSARSESCASCAVISETGNMVSSVSFKTLSSVDIICFLFC